MLWLHMTDIIYINIYIDIYTCMIKEYNICKKIIINVLFSYDVSTESLKK